MAENKIKINTNTLKNDTDTIISYLGKINSTIKQMQSDVQQLDRMWDGEANDAFNTAFQDDMTSLKSVCEEIQDIIDYETTAKTEYNSCETKVSGLIDDITV